jgi:hypothetical protein
VRVGFSATLLTVWVLAGAAHAESPWEGQRAAFFGVTFVDASHEGQHYGAREDETARVALVERYVREALAEQELVLVDLAPVENRLRRTRNPASCGGCELRMARELDARYAIVAEVHKVSNLILAMRLAIRDADSGRQVRGLGVDIRANTDQSWLRGMRYILDNGIFPTAR